MAGTDKFLVAGQTLEELISVAMKKKSSAIFVRTDDRFARKPEYRVWIKRPHGKEVEIIKPQCTPDVVCLIKTLAEIDPKRKEEYQSGETDLVRRECFLPIFILIKVMPHGNTETISISLA